MADSGLDLNVTTMLNRDKTAADALFELVANADDQHHNELGVRVIDAPPELLIEARTIIVRDMGKQGLNKRAFIVGNHKQTETNKQHGQFGLGLKDAVAVLMRDGFAITIKSIDEEFSLRVGPSLLDDSIETIKLYSAPRADSAGATGTEFRVEASNSQSSNSQSLRTIVADTKARFLCFRRSDEFLFEADGVQVFAPNSKTKASKSSCFHIGGQDKTAAGIFVAGRAVTIDPAQVTLFGYNFVKRTEEQRTSTDRDHNITSFHPFLQSIFSAFANSEEGQRALQTHAPDGPVREFRLSDQLKSLFDQAGDIVGVPGNGGCGLTPILVHSHIADGDPEAAPVEHNAADAHDGTKGSMLANWIQQTSKGLEQGKQRRLIFVQSLEETCRGILKRPCSLVPYGSVVYDVLGRGSDIDATLLLHGARDEEEHAANELVIGLKKKGFNVQHSRFHNGMHLKHLVVVQKSAKDGVPFDVDLCINGAPQIHKSLSLAEAFEELGSSTLPFIVKAWVQENKFTTSTGHRGMLPSYAWMLLVKEFLEEEPRPTAPSSRGVEDPVQGFIVFLEFLKVRFRKAKANKKIEVDDPYTFKAESISISASAPELLDLSVLETAQRRLERGQLPW
jgi:hypothetical protein